MKTAFRPVPGARRRSVPWGPLGLIFVFALGAIGCEQSAREASRESAAALESASPAPAARASPRQAFAGDEMALESEALAELDAETAEFNTEEYDRIDENPFYRAADQPLSTFAIDVDTASYSNVRRYLLRQRQLPPPDAVRIEELVNYFRYHDEPPSEGDPHPFSIAVELGRCPWNTDHQLARIGLAGRPIEADDRPPTNLVFLIDVSGSMDSPDKLPLLKRSMRLLVEQLGENDRVAIAVYASSEGLALPSTRCDNKETILEALETLEAGGSTAGAAGIQLAYELAADEFIPGGTNRVILCTDGDFNVGITDRGQLTRLIEEKARQGVFLSVLGFGSGNLKDATMESLADRGNGNYAYIDSIQEARRVLVEQMGATLQTIAKDVKIQVDFNPKRVGAYRLIGYENRLLEAEDFEDDTKDAGEIGAGHTVTALYELVPPGLEGDVARSAPESRYVDRGEAPESPADELFTVAVRYKPPDGDESRLIEVPVPDPGELGAGSEDLRFAAAVANFGMLLRGSEHAGASTYNSVIELAQSGVGADEGGSRTAFLELVQAARDLASENP